MHVMNNNKGDSGNVSPQRRGSISDGTTSIGGTTAFSGSIRSQHVAVQVKKIDAELKQRLSNNFNSVKRAFLELDEERTGHITAEQLAKFIGA